MNSAPRLKHHDKHIQHQPRLLAEEVPSQQGAEPGRSGANLSPSLTPSPSSQNKTKETKIERRGLVSSSYLPSFPCTSHLNIKYQELFYMFLVEAKYSPFNPGEPYQA